MTFDGEYTAASRRSTASAREPRTTRGHRMPHESPLGDGAADARARRAGVLAGFVNFPMHCTEGLAHLLEARCRRPRRRRAPDETSTWASRSRRPRSRCSASASPTPSTRRRSSPRGELRQGLWGRSPRSSSASTTWTTSMRSVIVRDGLYNGACAACRVVRHARHRWRGQRRRPRRRASAGDTLRWVQSGSVQAYGSVGFAGVVLAAFLMLVLLER